MYAPSNRPSQHGRAERPHADGGSEQKIHKKQLKEQRGISQAPHIDMRHAPRHRPRGKPQQRRAEPGGDGKGKPERRDTHGHAEPVEQRAGDCIQVIGCCNKQYLGEVIVYIQEVIMERCILFRVEHFQ